MRVELVFSPLKIAAPFGSAEPVPWYKPDFFADIGLKVSST